MISLVVITDTHNELWLPFCLTAIQRNLKGYDELVVVCDNDSFKTIGIAKKMGAKIAHNMNRNQIHHLFLRGAYDVMRTDQYVDESADYVAIIIPNFIVTKEFDLKNWVSDGKSCLLCDSYASLALNPGEIFRAVQYWKYSTELVLGIDEIEMEYARLLPVLYPKFIFEVLRKYLMSRLRVENMVDYLNLITNPEVPPEFCFNEYNVIGAYLDHVYGDKIFRVVISQSVKAYKYLPSGIVPFFEPTTTFEDALSLLKDSITDRQKEVASRHYLMDLLEEMEVNGVKLQS